MYMYRYVGHDLFTIVSMRQPRNDMSSWLGRNIEFIDNYRVWCVGVVLTDIWTTL